MPVLGSINDLLAGTEASMNCKLLVAIAVAFGVATSAGAGAQSRYGSLADTPFEGGYPTHDGIETLRDELFFERAVQSYIWALPALNMVAMKEGAEKTFGSGYNAHDSPHFPSARLLCRFGPIPYAIGGFLG
jgi:hypothetical protein